MSNQYIKQINPMFEFESCDDENENDDDDVTIRLFDAIVVLIATAIAVLLKWLPSAWEAMMVFT